MEIGTLAYFFFAALGLGAGLTWFAKDRELGDLATMLGVGVMAFPTLLLFLGNLFGIIHIPLDYRLILLIALAGFCIFYFCRTGTITFRVMPITGRTLFLALAIVLTLFTFAMYHRGAFAYPYLENDDPWEHALTAKFIAEEKSVREPIPGEQLFSYMDSYPPSYDAIFGLLHQTNDSIFWTIKFFNALLLALSILFAFRFGERLFQSSQKGFIFATFLAFVPAFMSHFIWSHALIPAIFFPAMECLLRIFDDKRWIFPAAVGVSSCLLIAPTATVKLAILLALYFIAVLFVFFRQSKMFCKQTFLALLLGVLISLSIWWGPMIAEYGLKGAVSEGLVVRGGTEPNVAPSPYIGYLGSATRLYTFKDFFTATSANMINNPVGIGSIACILVLIGLLFSLAKIKKQIKKLFREGDESPHLPEISSLAAPLGLFWVLFTLLGLYGGTVFPIAFFSFRFWMLFAFAAAILAADATGFLTAIGKKAHIPALIVIALVVFGLWMTSGSEKYKLNTMPWGPGGSWLSQEEIQGFTSLHNLDPGTKIMNVCSKRSAAYATSFDKLDCFWCQEDYFIRQRLMTIPPQELFTFLKNNGYEYLLIDGTCTTREPIKTTLELLNQKAQELAASGLFAPEQRPGIMLLAVR